MRTWQPQNGATCSHSSARAQAAGQAQATAHTPIRWMGPAAHLEHGAVAAALHPLDGQLLYRARVRSMRRQDLLLQLRRALLLLLEWRAAGQPEIKTSVWVDGVAGERQRTLLASTAAERCCCS